MNPPDYHQVLDAFFQAVWETDATGQAVVDSPSYRAYTGQSPEQWLRLGWLSGVRPHDQLAAATDWQQALQTQKPLNGDYRLLTPDGGWRWTNVRATALLEPDGSVRKWVGVLIDITHLKQAKEALREQQAQTQAFDNMLIWQADPLGDHIQLHTTWLDYTGQTFAQSQNYGWLQAIHPDDLEETTQVFTHAFQTGQPVERHQRIHNHKGEYRWFLVKHVPIQDETGRIIQWFGGAVDIHEQKLAQEALQVANRRKDEFLAMLAHELRHPIAILYHTLQLIPPHSQPERLPLSQALTLMTREVTGLKRMVDDLLDVSRISEGKIGLRQEPVDLRILVQQAIASSGPEFTRRQQLVRSPSTEGALWVMGDPTRLTQVIRNLLTNASKFTADGGYIQISLESQLEQAVLSVKDTGIGLMADQLQAIFDVFVQVSTSLDRPHGGLGLGLAVVKQLVELHKGHVEVQSSGLGKGSEFIVSLPLLAELPLLRPSVKTELPLPTSKLRILLVDDHAELARLTALVLEASHYTVHTCSSGEEAIASIERLTPDVVLLDLGMGGMDGFETCRRLRALPWGQEGLIVALSGYGQAEDRQRTRLGGFDGHLIKPLDIDALDQLLTDFFGFVGNKFRPIAESQEASSSQLKHDLRNCLSLIQFAVEQLGHVRSRKERQELMAMLDRNVQGIKGMIENLLG